MDDPGIKAIKFKLTNGISQEDEQVFQDRIKNIMLNDKPEILKNTDDIPLLPGTTLRLSAHGGLQFAGKIINLAGGKDGGDGGAKSDQKNTKQNKNSSGNQPSTSSEATSTSTSSNPAEYTFEYSENCPYCQNQKSEKKVDTDSRFNQRPLLNRDDQFDKKNIISAIEENNVLDVKNYLNEFPDRIKKPVRFEYSEAEASLLEVAIMKRKPEVVELLLEKGADVNQADNPILLACRPIDRLENKDLEIIHHLLRFGANPNAYQEEPWLETALLLCVTSDSEEAFNLLLTHGANPNPLQSLNDDNQLEMCKFYFKNKKFRFLEMLLKHGFDLNRCYKGGVYPLHIALMDQKVLLRNEWVVMYIYPPHSSSIGST